MRGGVWSYCKKSVCRGAIAEAISEKYSLPRVILCSHIQCIRSQDFLKSVHFSRYLWPPPSPNYPHSSLASKLGSLLLLFLPILSLLQLEHIYTYYNTSDCHSSTVLRIMLKLPSRAYKTWKLSAIQPYFMPLLPLLSNLQPQWYSFRLWMNRIVSPWGHVNLPFPLLKTLSQPISYIFILPPPFSATSLINSYSS